MHVHHLARAFPVQNVHVCSVTCKNAVYEMSINVHSRQCPAVHSRSPFPSGCPTSSAPRSAWPSCWCGLRFAPAAAPSTRCGSEATELGHRWQHARTASYLLPARDATAFRARRCRQPLSSLRFRRIPVSFSLPGAQAEGEHGKAKAKPPAAAQPRPKPLLPFLGRLALRPHPQRARREANLAPELW
jgi:hypothetical protein